MADGSVKQISDQNDDGYLNPGFKNLPTTDNPTTLFKAGPAEMVPADVFSGIFLVDPAAGKATDTEKPGS